jgi:DnaJ family protein C protein 28
VPLDIKALIGEPTPPWRIIAERKIQEWVDRGGPERLSNKGQQLDLTENPFVPSELRMAYRVMKSADVAPDWIEIGKDVEAQLVKAHEAALSFRHAQRNDRLSLRLATPVQIEAARDRMELRREHFADEQRARLNHVNHLVERFNRACPIMGLHRMKLDVEREVAEAARE